MTGKGSHAAAFPVAIELGPVRLAAQTSFAQVEKVRLVRRSSPEGLGVNFVSENLGLDVFFSVS